GVAHLALTFGKPLIVTDVGGLPEIIAGNGLVVAPGNAVALAAALDRLGADAALRHRLGRRSAALAATRHDWRRIAHDLLAAFPAFGITTYRIHADQDGNPDHFRT
ncbi:MAG: glycosyltransferase, partial [Streptosporangiaceae bacterium]